MSAAQLERLQEQMQRLRLFKSRERLEALLQDATAKEASYADFLDTLLAEEVASKTAKHVTMRTHLARFPFVKSLGTFDFSYQPSLDKKQIQTLSGGHFIEHGENVVLLGPPGVGKSQLAVGLGLKAIEHAGANLFFQLISRRYERGPMILTSNQSFGSGGDVFGDRVIHGDPRSRPAPCDHHQHPRQLLPAKGQTQSWPRQAGRGHDHLTGGGEF